MIAARTFWLVMGIVGLSAWPGIVAASGPWDRLLTVSRVEADPNKDYRLTDRNGPWMINACTFCGNGAQRQARELVLELRKRYKLTACTYSKKFEVREGDDRGGIDRYGIRSA